VHPEKTELFPLDVITAAQSQGDYALFRHSYRPEGSGSLNGYTIHSTVLNPTEKTPVIFGLFGPEGETFRHECESRFADLAAIFRPACQRASQICSDLRGRFDEDCANILINRCSGRIIYVNEATTTLLESDARALVDLEYTQFREKLAPVLTGFKQTLTNISIDDQRFALIALTDGPDRAREADPNPTGRLLKMVQDKVSRVTEATSRLNSRLEKDGAREAIELTGLILSQLRDLSRTVNQHAPLPRQGDMPNPETR
jgi:hypothetical protein